MLRHVTFAANTAADGGGGLFARGGGGGGAVSLANATFADNAVDARGRGAALLAVGRGADDDRRALALAVDSVTFFGGVMARSFRPDGDGETETDGADDDRAGGRSPPPLSSAPPRAAARDSPTTERKGSNHPASSSPESPNEHDRLNLAVFDRGVTAGVTAGGLIVLADGVRASLRRASAVADARALCSEEETETERSNGSTPAVVVLALTDCGDVDVCDSELRLRLPLHDVARRVCGGGSVTEVGTRHHRSLARSLARASVGRSFD